MGMKAQLLAVSLRQRIDFLRLHCDWQCGECMLRLHNSKGLLVGYGSKQGSRWWSRDAVPSKRWFRVRAFELTRPMWEEPKQLLIKVEGSGADDIRATFQRRT